MATQSNSVPAEPTWAEIVNCGLGAFLGESVDNSVIEVDFAELKDGTLVELVTAVNMVNVERE